MWQKWNPNPIANDHAGDCAVRAIAKALDLTWEQAYIRLSLNGFLMAEIPNADLVWGAVLREAGLSREVVPNSCPNCYTVEDFCNDHPEGTFVVKSENHVATVVDGVLYDSWDSSRNIPYYYWYLPEEKKG